MKILKELSREAFKERFDSKIACYEYLAELKWSMGYFCTRCEHEKYIKGKQTCSRRCCKCGYDEIYYNRNTFS